MFLDPEAPIATCIRPSCENCALASRLHCHFNGKDLATFLASVMPAFILGGIGLYRFGIWPFVLWVAFSLSYFGLIEIRVLCSHCPHYAEAGSTLRCWANYGSPKLWRYRPGPMSRAETIIFLAGLAFIFGYPAAVFLWTSQWLWAALEIVFVIAFFARTEAGMCNRCMNFNCPLNRVDQVTRLAFLKQNPLLEEARKREA